MKRASFFLVICICSIIPVAASELDTAFRKAAEDIKAETEKLAELRKKISTQRIEQAAKMDTLRTEVRALKKKCISLKQHNSRVRASLSDILGEKNILESEMQRLGVLLRNGGSDLRAVISPPEKQKYKQELDAVSDITKKTDADILENANTVLNLLSQRLKDNLGGCVFSGSALDSKGKVYAGNYLHAGPVDYFISSDGNVSGITGIQAGRSRPSVVYSVNPSILQKLLSGGEDEVPVDFTMGQVLQVMDMERSWTDHIAKGGVIMFPILGLGLICIAVVLLKLFFFTRITTDIQPAQQEIIELLKQGDVEEAGKRVAALGRPASAVFSEGIQHRDADREEIEELMHSRIAEEVPYLEKYLTVLSVSAAASPLLGLLGTVMGMIHTFNLITVFGTGKARLLSSGISEALITTEYGLIIAIPALLVHAYFSSKVRRAIETLEQGVGSFISSLKSGEQEK